MSADAPAGIILCGGRTRRFGGEKALVRVGGRAVVERVADALAPFCAEVLVVASPRREMAVPAGARVVEDVHPGAGPLGGIATGLRAMAADLALVVGCDMPFLVEGLLRLLVEQAAGFDAVVPRRADGYLEPLHALYRRACLPAVEEALARGVPAPWRVFGSVATRYVEEEECRVLDPEGLSFFNLNSPDDLARAEAIAARLG